MNLPIINCIFLADCLTSCFSEIIFMVSLVVPLVDVVFVDSRIADVTRVELRILEELALSEEF